MFLTHFSKVWYKTLGFRTNIIIHKTITFVFLDCIKFAPPVTTKLQVKENQDAEFLFNYILDDNEVVKEILFGYYEKPTSDKTPINEIIAIKTGSNDIEVNPAVNARYKDSNILFTVDNDSQAWFKLKSVSEVLDSDNTFYCQISLSSGNKIKKEILLEVICKFIFYLFLVWQDDFLCRL